MTADIHSLSGAYAVDALDDAERADFERHLEACAECRAEVASLRETAAELSALTQTAPPPSLRSAVLAEARTVRPLPPVTRTVVPLRRRPAAWVAGLAAAALLVVGGLVWSPWQHETGPGTRVVAQRVLDATDAQRITGSVSGSSATVVRSPSLGRAVLVADHLPTPSAGKEYQLWLDFPGRGMVSAGLVPVGSGTHVTYLLTGDAAKATAAGITLEPEGGSKAPTTEPLALFAF